jgi:CspA family cold shock protein
LCRAVESDYLYFLIYKKSILSINKTMQGTVKFFNETKGFGFITPSQPGEDIFVHASGLVDKIRENDKVEYDVERGKKGMNAVNVTLLN